MSDLLEFLKARCYRKGEFRLASEAMSDHYIDIRKASVSSVGADLIGEALYEETVHLMADAIGGPETGAIPLVTAAVLAYHRHLWPMEGFWVRNQPKRHGAGNLIEGAWGTEVIIVDDVVTSGRSALRAVEAVRALGGEVKMVLALVDRLAGAQELAGIEFRSVFTIEDFA